MIMTLRITSILSVALAIVFFVLPIRYGVRSDEEIKDFLASTSIVEQFKSAEGTEVKTAGNQVSRLVQEAQAFALYLNPPKPKINTTQRTNNVNSLNSITQIDTKPKFTIIGTSVYYKQPERSMALIDEPGKGIHWVKQSDAIGHLLIQQVKDGIIVVKSGTETYELEVQKTDNTPSRITVSPSITPSSATYSRTPTQTPSERVPIARPQRSQQDVDPSLNLEIIIDKINLIQENTNLSEDEKNEEVERLITDLQNLQATYVDGIEAEALNNLGEILRSEFLDSNNPSK
ncbi:hypothetical protein ACFLZ8_02360 [Planctomycetota bacterium]